MAPLPGIAEEEASLQKESPPAEENGGVECASTTSKLIDKDELVVKPDSVNEDPDGALLGSSPTTSKNHLFVSKSGRTWEIGEDVACLRYELKIKLGEAEALTEDGEGLDAGQILAILRAAWKKIKANSSAVGYMREVIRNSVSKGKASESAAPTSNPLPRSAAPLPTQAPAVPPAKAKPAATAPMKVSPPAVIVCPLETPEQSDAAVIAALAKLGTGNVCHISTAMSIGRDYSKLAAWLPDMVRRELLVAVPVMGSSMTYRVAQGAQAAATEVTVASPHEKVLAFLAANRGWSSRMAVMDCMGKVGSEQESVRHPRFIGFS